MNPQQHSCGLQSAVVKMHRLLGLGCTRWRRAARAAGVAAGTAAGGPGCCTAAAQLRHEALGEIPDAENDGNADEQNFDDVISVHVSALAIWNELGRASCRGRGWQAG